MDSLLPNTPRRLEGSHGRQRTSPSPNAIRRIALKPVTVRMHCTPFRWSTSPFPTESLDLVSANFPKGHRTLTPSLQPLNQLSANASYVTPRFILSFPKYDICPSGPKSGMTKPSQGRGKYRSLKPGVNVPKQSHLAKFDLPEDFGNLRMQRSARKVESGDDLLEILPAISLVLGLSQEECRVICHDDRDSFVMMGFAPHPLHRGLLPCQK